jgi:hypothetical protein
MAPVNKTTRRHIKKAIILNLPAARISNLMQFYLAYIFIHFPEMSLDLLKATASVMGMAEGQPMNVLTSKTS